MSIMFTTLCDLAKVACIAFSAVSQIEKGERIPRGDMLERLAVALNVAPCWLSYGDGPKPEGYALANGNVTDS